MEYKQYHFDELFAILARTLDAINAEWMDTSCCEDNPVKMARARYLDDIGCIVEDAQKTLLNVQKTMQELDKDHILKVWENS